MLGLLQSSFFHCVTPKLFNQPTKDRAKKRRKVKDAQAATKEQDKPSATNLVRVPSQATAKIRTSSSFSTTEAEATELQVTHIPTTIDQPIGAVELPITNGFRSVVPTSRIEVSSLTSAAPFTPPEQTKRTSRIGRALPGLIAHHRAVEPVPVVAPPKSPSSLHKLREDVLDDQPIHAAIRYPRVPTAGSRPTVMDVAFTFGQQTENDTATPDAQIRNPATVVTSESKSEKRRSTLDKYSSIMLPTLKEEATPSASPIGTLSQPAIPLGASRFVNNAMFDKKSADSSAPTTIKLVHLGTVQKQCGSIY
jgi:hypothetical protein